jgi:hypothetical protein
MKSTLVFNLPEDREEFEHAIKAIQYLSIIDEMDNYLRGKIKYGELPEAQENIYQEIRDKLWELKNEYKS